MPAKNSKENYDTTVAGLTDQIILVKYPPLFSLLNEITDIISAIRLEEDIQLLASIAQKINEELDELYRKEKLVLFPYIRQLAATQKKSEGNIPFKNVKIHSNALLNATNKLEEVITKKITTSFPHKAHLLDKLDIFKQQFTTLQQFKEQILFSPYRSCNGDCTC